ncbi:hypothetical protein [Nocardia brasiliensis]
MGKTQTQQPAGDSPVSITGEKRNADDVTALRKIARACIALARQQLTQEQKADHSEAAPTLEGGADA